MLGSELRVPKIPEVHLPWTWNLAKWFCFGGIRQVRKAASNQEIRKDDSSGQPGFWLSSDSHSAYVAIVLAAALRNLAVVHNWANPEAQNPAAHALAQFPGPYGHDSYSQKP